jgi:hypothetical protein
MTNLKILYAYGNCGIDDDGIKHINHIELYSLGNTKISKR